MATQKHIAQAKEVIKEYIRSAVVGGGIRIPVEDEANLALFQQVNRSADIQSMAAQKHIAAIEFYIPDVVGQAKEHMLKYINGARSEVRQVIFPCLHQDYVIYHQALQSDEIQRALQRRGITASLRTVSRDGEPCPDIIIATLEDAHNGKLKRFLEKFEGP
ncbi:hypothetical protein [Iningainema tapete]|uniref:Uncharacterized protein n=1 Tax=Iningainema tapete BLCC-T55 TaxID=2748662 RepID=A0A8J7C8V3_9CYAN|nr:hypothetical protein [Iningainema tapete]MBD2775186.1 hypothetical protein [Iningainema tapete BLCC-T55]